MDTRKGITLGRDAAGNHTSNGLGQTYAWDGHGHLSQFNLNGVQKATYFYNYQHQRTHKNLWNGSTALGTTVYHYDLQGRLLRETSSTGAVLATYIYDEAGTPLAIIQAANSPYNATTQDQVVYLHTGHLGTPRMATDSNRRIVWKWESDAFGTTVPQQDPDGDGKQTIVNLRFPGQYYDAESGLHQNWHRTYDPSLGRYISSDPIGLAGGVNAYGYVGQSPLNLIDPSGENALAVEAAEEFGYFVGSKAVAPLINWGIATATGVAGATLGTWAYDITHPESENADTTWVINENSNDDGAQCPDEGNPDDKKLSEGEIDKLKDAGINPHDLKPKRVDRNLIYSKTGMEISLSNLEKETTW
ncbi:MAG: RHS domain-containing protein [Candidatus Thiothrix singaporensis]|uniref:RHS domain-containing protein n=1 Tax=Candidatus Thiothrix singaporensis TaxID=2799669 RepID=A0A7L6AW73_9GAMM|nr:MAG: RHS domain-containing protein [Candidatus Thiothrix singaporensis]